MVFFFSLSSLSLSLRSTFFCGPPSFLIVFGVLLLMYIGDTRCFSFSPIEGFLFLFFLCCCFCLSLFFSLNSVSFYSVDALLRFNRSISGCKLNDSADITELQKRVFFLLLFSCFDRWLHSFHCCYCWWWFVCLFVFFRCAFVWVTVLKFLSYEESDNAAVTWLVAALTRVISLVCVWCIPQSCLTEPLVLSLSLSYL